MCYNEYKRRGEEKASQEGEKKMKKDMYLIRCTREGKEYVAHYGDFTLRVKTKSKRFFEVKVRESLNLEGKHTVYFYYADEEEER